MGTTTLDVLLQTGLSLPALDYFKLAESSGTTAANEISGRSAGTYVNTPTLASAGDIYGESNGGNAVTLNGTDEYVDLGTSSREWAGLIDGGGITIVGVFKQLSTPGTADRVLLGIAGNNGFRINLHRGSNTMRMRIEMTDNAGGVTYRNMVYWLSNGTGREPYRMSPIWFRVTFNKTGNVARFWMDGIEHTQLEASANGATGTFNNSSNNVYAGALDTSGSPTANTYLNAMMQRIAAYNGELTDADMIAIMRAATRTDVTGKLYGLIDEFNTADEASMGIDGPSGRVDTIQGRFGNLADQVTEAKMPTFQNGELDFDGTWQNRLTPVRQALASTLDQAVLGQWMTLAAVARPAVDRILTVGGQEVIGFRYSGATWVGLGIDTTGKWCVSRNGTAFVPANPFPRARCLPGVSCGAITIGYDQATFKPGIFSDGTFAQGASSFATGSYWDQVGADYHIGGDPSTYGNLFSGRTRNIIVARCPILPSALADWEVATRTALGYATTPEVHIHIAGDSISSMQAASANKGWQTSLPDRATYTNSSADGDKQADQITTLTAWGANLFASGAATKIGLITVGRNDASVGTTLGTMQTQYASIRSLLITAGATHIIAVKINPSDLGSTGASWNAYLDTVVGLGLADAVVTLPSMTPGNGLTVADGIHPNDAGHAAMYSAIWAQALSGFFPSSGAQGVRMGRKRAVLSRRRRAAA